MKKYTMGILTVMLLIVALAGVIVGAPVVFNSGTAHAELAKTKMVALSGVDYSDALGNTVSAFTGRKLGINALPDELNCFFTVTNASGVGVGNNATVNLETSINNVDYALFRTVAVANSTVTGVYNTPADTVPFGNYWRVDITALQNANDSYVRARCLFE